jgi:hypothetical protein
MCRLCDFVALHVFLDRQLATLVVMRPALNLTVFNSQRSTVPSLPNVPSLDFIAARAFTSVSKVTVDAVRQSNPYLYLSGIARLPEPQASLLYIVYRERKRRVSCEVDPLRKHRQSSEATLVGSRPVSAADVCLADRAPQQ